VPRQTLDDVLASLSGPRMRDTVKEIAARGSPAQGQTADMNDIIDAVTGAADLGDGAAAWAARMRLKRAIVAMVEAMPGMTYVEGDA